MKTSSLLLSLYDNDDDSLYDPNRGRPWWWWSLARDCGCHTTDVIGSDRGDDDDDVTTLLYIVAGGPHPLNADSPKAVICWAYDNAGGGGGDRTSDKWWLPCGRIIIIIVLSQPSVAELKVADFWCWCGFKVVDDGFVEDFEDFPLQLDELRRRKNENPLNEVGVSGGWRPCGGPSEK